MVIDKVNHFLSYMEFEKYFNLGALGEDTLAKWCREVGIVITSSAHEDVNGWDSFLEFPYLKTDLPRDLQSTPIECKVQVKSTQGKRGKCDIKLSALKRLVNYNSPAFILFLEFSEDSLPHLESAYLVHVDESLIHRVLKKVRKNDISKAPKELNKLVITVNYDEKVKLRSTHASEFVDKVLTHIPSGMDKYQENKKAIIKTTGYGESGFSFSFKAEPSEIQNHLKDSYLGYQPVPINVSESITKDNRFDLSEGAVVIEESQNAQVTITPNVSGQCNLKVRTTPYSPAITFLTDIVHKVCITAHDTGLFLRSDLFSIEISVKEGEFHVTPHLTTDKTTSIQGAINFLRVFHASQRHNEQQWEMHFLEDDRKLNATCTVSHQDNKDDLIESLILIYQSYNLEPSKLVSLDQLAQDEERINVLAKFLRNEPNGVCLEPHPNDVIDAPDDIQNVMPFVVQVGEYVLGSVFLMHANVEDSKYVVHTIETLEPFVFENRSPTNDELEEITQIHINRLEQLTSKS
ncbi:MULTISPECIES: hypothetical protein [Vibrio harveyi group]|uniref:hypothetical protein n=1 Tax=Vibrio harveyi group TaxID=717610 RepID=UPI000CF442BB|nr:hypothetical protein [Vibrio jasicida]PQJ47488.1 hypothetical protein BTO01_28685 [Vibrio jasicida]